MTNAVHECAQALTAANTNAVWDVCIYEPIDPFVAIWAVSLLVVPIVSVIVFVKCWNSRRRIDGNAWYVHALLLAALVMATTTACTVFSMINHSFYCAGAHPFGAATQAMCNLALAHACNCAIIGILATAFSLALAIVASMIKKSNDGKP
jgi:hypothetical protein